MKRTASRWRQLSLLTILFLILSGCTEAGTWDLLRREQSAPVWAASMQIDVDASGVSQLLSDVPVLVRLTPATFDYALSARAGQDMGFYSEPYQLGSEPLDHTVVQWNPSGESHIWVRVPLIVPGVTASLYLHVGNSRVLIPENPAGVWRNGYAAVYLFDDPESPFEDATRFGNHGQVNVNEQSEPSRVAGLVGSAIETARSTDAVVIPDSDTLRTLGPFTISFWVQESSSFSGGRLFDKSRRYLNVSDSGAMRRFQVRVQHSPTGAADGDILNDVFGEWDSSAPAANEWRNVALSWSGNPGQFSLDLYVDGSREPTINTGGSPADEATSDSGSPLVIGNSGFAGTSNFKGRIDQVEVSFAERSLDWVQFHVATVEQTNMSYGPLVRR